MTDFEPLYDMIRRFEGLRLKAYLCPAGVWTCGYGSTGADVGPETEWTLIEAERRMKLITHRCVVEAKTLSPKLSGDKLCAIADFIYNLGATRYKGSTLRKRVDAEDWSAAAIELMKWVRGGGRILPGLVLRRHEEVTLLTR